jgi:hypothetical protein
MTRSHTTRHHAHGRDFQPEFDRRLSVARTTVCARKLPMFPVCDLCTIIEILTWVFLARATVGAGETAVVAPFEFPHLRGLCVCVDRAPGRVRKNLLQAAMLVWWRKHHSF